MKQLQTYIIGIIFMSVLFVITILNVIDEDQVFSDRENRYLKQLPTFTIDRFLSGRFVEEFETYMQDQFLAKKLWVEMKSESEQLLLKQENNSIYFGRKGYLFEPFQQPKKQLLKNINYLNSFTEVVGKEIHATFLPVPTSIAIYEELLPLFAPSDDQENTIRFMQEHTNDNIEIINIFDILLQNKEDDLYYRTDHHWTTHGAFYAYKALGEQLGYIPYSKEDFNIKTISRNFFGTYYAKANDSQTQPDDITIYEPTFKTDYEVTFLDNHVASNSLYSFEHLRTRDQYSVFLDGNHSLVKIKSHVNNGRKLGIIKDSYAHSLIPFLANHFDEIHMIDLRYYHLNIEDYLKKHHINQILFTYNIPNFSEDTNIGWLK